MADFLTREERSRMMSRIRSSGTRPEVSLRKALWHEGFRYRVNVRSLPGSPDIVLPKYRTVVFVHGCFWHGHHGCKDYVVPKTNTAFWVEKIKRNKDRDEKVWRSLLAKGWEVIIVWECELSKELMYSTVARVVSAIRKNGMNLNSFIEDRKRVNCLHIKETQARGQ